MPDADPSVLMPRLHPTQARAIRLRLQRLVRDASPLAPAAAESMGTEPFWEVEPTPFVISAGEWRDLSAAVIQRARMINAFLRDIYSGQRVLHSRQLPPEVILGDPHYRRPCLGLEPDRSSPATLLRFDLLKSGGGWVFSGVRTNSPVGMSYAVQNRRFLSQESGHLYETLPDYWSIINFPLEMLESLRQLSPRYPQEASIVVLTSGPQDPYYSAHSFLARKMGVPLARGDDLLVLDNCVYFKTIAGLERVDVIFRRVDDAQIDPVVFTTLRQAEGVPGLIQCVRQRRVVLANAIGTGVAESRALDAFSSTLCRFYLGESLLLPSVPTFLVQDEEAVESLIARFGALRLRLAHPLAPAALLNRPPTEILIRRGERIPAYVKASPHEYVLQAIHTPEQAAPGQHRAGAATLSTFVLAQGNRYKVLPGGLAYLGGESPSLLRVGRVSDVVVLQGGADESEVGMPGPAALAPAAPRTPLGSRAAESLYWFGRYLERAENTARMLSIFEDVALEEIPARDRRKWIPIWQGVLEATGHAAVEFGPANPFQTVQSAELTWHMSLDRTHPSSFFSSVEMAAENARQLRDCLSPEVWGMLAQLHQRLQALEVSAAAMAEEDPARDDAARAAVQEVLAGVNALLGTAERTLLQDASWGFLRIGMHLERATMTCSALRHILSALEREASEHPSVADHDSPELSALVRMLGSQDAYRRIFQAPSVPPLVAELFLQQPAAPRSIRHNVQQIAGSLDALQQDAAMPEELTGNAVRAHVEDLLTFLGGLSFDATRAASVAGQPGADTGEGGPLEQQLSILLQQLYLLHTRLSDHYFSHQGRLPVMEL